MRVRVKVRVRVRVRVRVGVRVGASSCGLSAAALGVVTTEHMPGGGSSCGLSSSEAHCARGVTTEHRG